MAKLRGTFFFTFLVQKLNHVLLTKGSHNSSLNIRTRNQTESLTDGPRGSDYCIALSNFIVKYAQKVIMYAQLGNWA